MDKAAEPAIFCNALAYFQSSGLIGILWLYAKITFLMFRVEYCV
ncbi:hypothetical protein ABWED_2570 [Acinetobacter lwoffii]|jgi:hypothetical protein|nr:hypothetical protein ABWED_2570 [Acinetobacter lwoffii]